MACIQSTQCVIATMSFCKLGIFPAFVTIVFNGTPSVCVSIDYVKPWKLVTLEPCDTSGVLCDMELDDLA